MSFSFQIEVQGHTLEGYIHYKTRQEAENSAYRVIAELGGIGKVAVLEQYPAFNGWTPDQAEINLLRRLRDGASEYGRITAVGFIKSKANCLQEEATDYFNSYFPEL